jgi:hypothetical protein
MSTVATKVQRFVVTFDNKPMFVNASSADEALDRSRTKRLAEHALLKTEPSEELATQEVFNAVARARVSVRY